MSKRAQRRALSDLAGTLRDLAAAIEEIAAPGRPRLRGPDQVAAAEAMIEGGVSLFDTAAAVLRSGKPSRDDLTAADALETTAAAWRPKENKNGP